MAGGAWSVYLLLCADGTFYCGITLDVPRRVAMHNGLLPGGAKYTRGRRPVRLVSCAGGFCRAEALRLERRIKKLPHARKAEALFLLIQQPVPRLLNVAVLWFQRLIVLKQGKRKPDRIFFPPVDNLRDVPEM